MLEPRRVAARAVAARMATTLGESVGETIGYRMRLDTRVRPRHPHRGGHRRRADAHAAGGSGARRCRLRDLRRIPRTQPAGGPGPGAEPGCAPPARCLVPAVIMSATLEGERVVQLLGDAARVRCRGAPSRRGAISRPWGAAAARRGLDGAARRPPAVERWRAPCSARSNRRAATCWCFCRARARLAHRRRPVAARTARGVRVLPLYGQMQPAAQDAVLAPAAPGTRKVVLATNIAETSLTIPGVTAVVDCGLARRSRFDPVTGMSRLDLERISRAASEQRRGRAGRVAPGVCYRLWSEGAQLSLAAVTHAGNSRGRSGAAGTGTGALGDRRRQLASTGWMRRRRRRWQQARDVAAAARRA